MAHVGGALRSGWNWIAAVAGPAGLIGAALLAPAVEAAEWAPAQEISEPGTFTSGAQLGVDESGDATAVWTADFTKGSIRSAHLPAGGAWQGVQTPISTATCEKPSLAVGASGAAVVVADCGAGELLATFRPTASASWGSAVEVPGSEGSTDPEAAIDGAGNALVVWDRAETIESSYRPAATGTWGTAQKLSGAGTAGSEPAARVAIGPDGSQIAVWSNKEGSTYRINEESRSAGAASNWIGPSKYPTLGGEAYAPALAINAGKLVIVWAHRATSLEPFSIGSFWGQNGTQHEVTEAAGLSAESPSVAIDAQGRALAVWRGFPETGEGVMRIAAATEFGGAWSPAATLPTPGGDYLPGYAPPPQVAIDDAGDANAVWSTHGGTLYAASGTATSSFGEAVPISNANGAYAEEKTPNPLVMDHTGTAFAAWTAATGGRLTVAMRDGAPPKLSGLVVPVSGEIGKSAAMSAMASDVWSPPTTVRWDFGDGTGGSGSSVSHAYGAAGTYTVTVSAADAQGNVSAAQTRRIAVTGSGGETRKPAVVVHISVAKQTWKAIARAKAIKVKCRLDLSGTCAVAATLGAGTAKALGLRAKGGKPLVVGRGSLAVSGTGIVTVTVKLTKQALKAIGAATKSVSVALTATGSAPNRRDATQTRKLKIKRP